MTSSMGIVDLIVNVVRRANNDGACSRRPRLRTVMQLVGKEVNKWPIALEGVPDRRSERGRGSELRRQCSLLGELEFMHFFQPPQLTLGAILDDDGREVEHDDWILHGIRHQD